MSNFMKILPAGAELFHADGQTKVMKLIVAFRNLRTRVKLKAMKLYRCSLNVVANCVVVQQKISPVPEHKR
jgi:hypothetical protein